MPKINLEPVRPHVEILRWVKRRKAELKELEENARSAVEVVMGEADEGELDGETVVTWHRHKRRTLDQSALKDAEPYVHEEYMTTTVVRRFEVVGE